MLVGRETKYRRDDHKGQGTCNNDALKQPNNSTYPADRHGLKAIHSILPTRQSPTPSSSLRYFLLHAWQPALSLLLELNHVSSQPICYISSWPSLLSLRNKATAVWCLADAPVKPPDLWPASARSNRLIRLVSQKFPVSFNCFERLQTSPTYLYVPPVGPLSHPWLFVAAPPHVDVP